MKEQELIIYQNHKITETPYDEIKIPEKDKKIPTLRIPSERMEDNININLYEKDSQKKRKEEKKEEDEKYETGAKRNLMFEQQNISPMQLFCHLSGKLEVILMIIGFISAMGSGVAAPLMTYLFGDTFNEFTGVTELIEIVPEETLQTLFKTFEHNIDKMVKKLLYIGT